MKNMNVRKLLLGTNERDGLLSRIFLYGVLLGMGFVFMYPVLYMISTSFMSTGDLVDATVSWIPRQFSLEVHKAAATLGYGRADHIPCVLLFPAVLQTISLAFAGFGLAVLKYP